MGSILEGLQIYYHRSVKIFIRNMQCLQDIQRVRAILDTQNLSHISVELGEVEANKLSKENTKKLHGALTEVGMGIVESKKLILIERIKTLVILMIRFSDELPAENYSHHISKKLGYNYTYLANLFSSTENITIEHFIIKHKIEKVKELLSGEELNLTEITEKMHYSSVAHLSNQFKKVTGFTTTYFKNNPDAA